VSVEPFFISADDKPFNQHKFWAVRTLFFRHYGSVLNLQGQNVLISDDEADDDYDFLPTAISISRINDLLEQMRFHEVPKRALFSIPFELARGLVIGIKGYGLVTEQKKGAYKYFVDLGDKMEVVESRTMHVDEVCVRLHDCMVMASSLCGPFCKGARGGGQQEPCAIWHDTGCDSRGGRHPRTWPRHALRARWSACIYDPSPTLPFLL